MEIDKLTFKANFGDEVKEVELSTPTGGAGGYFVMINNFYRGSLFKRQGVWVGFFNLPNDFAAADIFEMGAIIDAGIHNNYQMERFAFEFEKKEITVKAMTSDNKLFMISIDKTFFGYVAIKNSEFILQPDSSISADQLQVIKTEIQGRL